MSKSTSSGSDTEARIAESLSVLQKSADDEVLCRIQSYEVKKQAQEGLVDRLPHIDDCLFDDRYIDAGTRAFNPGRGRLATERLPLRLFLRRSSGLLHCY